MITSKRQWKVKFAAATSKVYVGYKMRKVDPPNALKSGIAEQSRSKCPSAGDGVSPLEDDRGQVDKLVLSDEGPGPSDSPNSGGNVCPLEDDRGPVDKSVLTSFERHVAYAIWNRSKALGDYGATGRLLSSE
ncbi:hypothetical protein LguiA_018661 [Lonicera macranthoides]